MVVSGGYVNGYSNGYKCKYLNETLDGLTSG